MSDGKSPVDPTRLSIEQAVKLLSAAYRERLEVAKIQEDIDAGAPINADGTINLVSYTAWQAEKMGRGDRVYGTKRKRPVV